MVDRAARDLVVAREAGEDRQAGRVGRRPARRSEPVRPQVPDRARAGVPAAARPRERVQLVEPARVAVDDQRVPVARRPRRRRCAGSGTGPCRSRRRSRSSTRERGVCAALTTSNGMPIGRRPTGPSRSRDEAPCRAPIERMIASEFARDRQLVDALVPRVRLREDRATRRARHAERLRRRAAEARARNVSSTSRFTGAPPRGSARAPRPRTRRAAARAPRP